MFSELAVVMEALLMSNGLHDRSLPVMQCYTASYCVSLALPSLLVSLHSVGFEAMYVCELCSLIGPGRPDWQVE